MLIGERIRQLREQKGLSQAEIERSTGLLRTYVSRVEHGHAVPSLESLERLAAALDVPLYRLFYSGEDSLAKAVPDTQTKERAHFFEKVQRLLKKESRESGDASLAFETLAKMAAALSRR
jgi:transcriptional regulator with XRE-family HTH domain